MQNIVWHTETKLHAKFGTKFGKYRLMFFYSIEIQALLRKKRSSFSMVLHSPLQLCTTFALYRPRTRNRIEEHSHIKLFPCIKFEVMDREVLASFSTGDSWISRSISDHLPLQGNAEVPLSTLTWRQNYWIKTASFVEVSYIKRQ